MYPYPSATPSRPAVRRSTGIILLDVLACLAAFALQFLVAAVAWFVILMSAAIFPDNADSQFVEQLAYGSALIGLAVALGTAAWATVRLCTNKAGIPVAAIGLGLQAALWFTAALIAQRAGVPIF